MLSRRTILKLVLLLIFLIGWWVVSRDMIVQGKDYFDDVINMQNKVLLKFEQDGINPDYSYQNKSCYRESVKFDEGTLYCVIQSEYWYVPDDLDTALNIAKHAAPILYDEISATGHEGPAIEPKVRAQDSEKIYVRSGLSKSRYGQGECSVNINYPDPLGVPFTISNRYPKSKYLQILLSCKAQSKNAYFGLKSD